MTSIKDVAKKAGVSVTTVSRVINNRGYIGKETRKKVETAMKNLNYQPNQIARSLQNSKTTFIGVIVPDSSHPFFSEVIKYIEINANENGFKTIICNSLDDYEKEKSYIDMLKANRIAGIIMCGQTLEVSHYESLNFPIVTFDRIISNIPYVGSDNYLGGVLATRHLIDKGCKRLLHISGPFKRDMLSNRRGSAFSITCKENDIPYKIIENKNNFFGIYKYDDLYAFIKKEVGPYINEFDGVFCSDDLLAYVLYAWATNNGVAIPDQLKIVGYDYHGFTRLLQTPKLTTISQPTDQIGHVLSSTLIDLILENEDVSTIQNKVVNVELIKGSTT
ncbi:LacI family DNA-binding transcriptional regulator [Amphibacillus jilinensis]|uniref:LacI family DNA-binding transcriptional regulator n=1 Tax=Amphibacillus jilinensis TaxID=1216008 RepID=UPI00031225CF|nr:LacI family DNA-binding transcriptional regulator [Amphibacillus jilinensis]